MTARLVLLATLAALALPAAARADDASLARAWARYVHQSPHREVALITDRLAQVRRGLRRDERLIQRTRRTIAPDHASSELGAAGRKAALRSLGRASAAIRGLRRFLPLVARTRGGALGRRARRRLSRLAFRASTASLEARRLQLRATRLFDRATA